MVSSSTVADWEEGIDSPFIKSVAEEHLESCALQSQRLKAMMVACPSTRYSPCPLAKTSASDVCCASGRSLGHIRNSKWASLSLEQLVLSQWEHCPSGRNSFVGVGQKRTRSYWPGRRHPRRDGIVISAQAEPLDLTEDNVQQVLFDARSELLQIFDTSVGITGMAELAELDGPFVKLRLTGRFWHERSMVLARLTNYLKKRIPEVLEVEIEDEAQLDDSAANF